MGASTQLGDCPAAAFQSKLGELETAHQRGEAGAIARLTADEVSAAVKVGNAQPQVAPTTALDSGTPAPKPTPEQVPVKDTQVVFERDQVKCQFSAQVYGKDMIVTLAAHLGARDGYVTFIPTSFKIGSMPVPLSIVQTQLDQKLSEPETREKLKLPEFVSDVRIEDGQLVIVEK